MQSFFLFSDRFSAIDEETEKPEEAVNDKKASEESRGAILGVQPV